MECIRYYFSLLNETVTLTYAILYLFVGVTAVAGNAIALRILLKSDMKTKSNKILKSLTIADLLVGFIACPVFVFQLMTRSYLHDCMFENIRNQVVLSLTSTSALNMVFIACDRYILMTRLTNYDKCMGDSKLNILITMAWVIPPCIYSLRYINYTIYRMTFLACDVITVVMIIVSYLLVLHRTRQMQARLNQHRNTSNVSSYQIQLSRNVTIIVTGFILCAIPAFFTVLLGYIYEPKEIRSVYLQHAFLFSFFTSSLNSCVNPLIYAWKFPRFKQHLLKMFSRKLGAKYEMDMRSWTRRSTVVTSVP